MVIYDENVLATSFLARNEKKRKKEPEFDMPYKDINDHRKVDREAHQRRALSKKFDKYRDANGKIVARAFIEDNLELILMDLLSPRGIPTRKSEMMLKIVDVLKDKQEVDHKIEFTVTDRQQLFTEFRDALRRETESSRVCPVCHQHKAIGTGARLDTESESQGY